MGRPWLLNLKHAESSLSGVAYDEAQADRRLSASARAKQAGKINLPPPLVFSLSLHPYLWELLRGGCRLDRRGWAQRSILEERRT